MRIGFLLYDRVTSLDLFGPLDVMARVKSWDIEIFSCSRKLYSIGNGISLMAQTVINDETIYDAVVIPGGIGQVEFCENLKDLNKVKNICLNTKYVLAICTGSLILGFCGLLKGRMATTHHQYIQELENFGAISKDERVVEDQNVITCGGVTSGIDLALYFVKKIEGSTSAKKIQIAIEYNPLPIYNYKLLQEDMLLKKEIEKENLDLVKRRKDQVERFLAIESNNLVK